MNLFDPPNFAGSPPICRATNLRAFEPKQWPDFERTNCPGAKVILQFTCLVCGKIHVWSVASDPAGGSSGTTRTAKHHEKLHADALIKFRPFIS